MTAANLPVQMHPVPVDLPVLDIHLLFSERYRRDPAHRWLRQVVVEAARPWREGATA